MCVTSAPQVPFKLMWRLELFVIASVAKLSRCSLCIAPSAPHAALKRGWTLLSGLDEREAGVCRLYSVAFSRRGAIAQTSTS